MLDANVFSDLKIGLASAETIRTWSNGEVKKPETINYRTLKPEKDGLFCEKIFGPTKDWECSCGKYKRVRFKGIMCERCGVEVTRSSVRRERMGHLELAAPAVHIWYLRGTRSWLAYLLSGRTTSEDLKAKQLEKVIYFAANLVVSVDEEARDLDRNKLEGDVTGEREELQQAMEDELEDASKKLEKEIEDAEKEGSREAALKAMRRSAERELAEIRDDYETDIRALDHAWEEFKKLHVRQIIDDERLWSEMKGRWEKYFTGGMGAKAIADLIDSLDFDEEEAHLREQLDPESDQKNLSTQRQQKAIKQLKIYAAFNRRNDYGRRLNDPRSMILDAIPIIPPELRPMVQLDGGRFATSDLNDLYRRVINRNNRLKRLIDIGAPEIIVNNEKRMLQEAVDALFDNGRRGRPVTGPGNRPLKSLSDMLKGKQGRFRQNLLGKRVDYSGRSVIVVGPTLKLHQCGLPKIMALELFKPFVMKKLVDVGLAPNIKTAKRMVERRHPQVWDVLEDVIQEHPVLLNRAPTLHRLGIQAFEPVLVEGKAIRLHPLVCTAFNADFDGDQMAVHLPLSAEAQAEARVLLLSANNVLSPANGRPLVTPTQDMIIGAFYLTQLVEGAKGEGRAFKDSREIETAYEQGDLAIHAKIQYRIPDLLKSSPGEPNAYEPTTTGRVLFNNTLPKAFGYVNNRIDRKLMGKIVDDLARGYTKQEVAVSLDAIKDLCFTFATRSGLTVSIEDVATPREKAKILDRHEKMANTIDKQFRRGVITDGERRQMEVELWSRATTEVTQKMQEKLESDDFNPVNMMVSSGARGNITQVRQIAGMRGLVANPRGDMIPRPIKSNFREGLKVLEYFIATPGARKGLVDTALRTADSGYLTRRLVDVAQELIINRENPFERPGGARGIWLEDVVPDTPEQLSHLETRLFGRVLAQDVELADGTKMERGTMVGEPELATLRDDETVTRVRVLSPLTDDSAYGISAMSYGMSLATGEMIEVGEAVGVIAAQSIGEPGTQLTMRTFHTGGVADAQVIAGGLPRVVELFEARTPKGKATLARSSGTIRFGQNDKGEQQVTIVADDGDEMTYSTTTGARLNVTDGQNIKAGDAIVEGARDPKELLEIKGVRETQQYLVDEVQKVYRDQGVSIHDKHIELIVRQMTKRIMINEPGDTDFLPGYQVAQKLFADTNRRVHEEGGQPAEGRPQLMGITKASLATESWLSAASFQETTRVLTEAAIESRSDTLHGLKENIIIGKLIPSGTGIGEYQNIKPHAVDFVPMDYYSSDETPEDMASWLASRSEAIDGDGGEASEVSAIGAIASGAGAFGPVDAEASKGQTAVPAGVGGGAGAFGSVDGGAAAADEDAGNAAPISKAAS